jgi:prevent-host-death family protein
LEILNRVEKSEQIVITENGKLVARLVPEAVAFDKVQARAAVERMRERAKTLAAAFDCELLRGDRDEGRP